VARSNQRDVEVMEEKSPPIEPYRPSRIHKLYGWIDRLPGPYWLYYFGVILTTGLLNHIVAWNEHVLVPGEINWYFAFTAFFLAYYLFANDFLFRVARDSLVEFRPVLDATQDEYHRLVFEFTHLPARASTVVFISGTSIGLALGLYLLPIAPEMNRAFPELEVPIFSLSLGMVFLASYVVVRAFRLVSRVFDNLRTVDIYDQSSIYAMSRYSAWLVVLAAIPTYLTFVLAPALAEITLYYFLFLVAIVYVLLLAVFWLPLRGVNRRLVLEKRRLLTEVNLRIQTTFDLIHSRIDEQEFKDIVELRETIDSLKIEKEFIESIRTWPWRPGTLTGLLSAVVLPLLVNLLIDIVFKFITSGFISW
jgi:hypothetical protein